MKGPTGQGWRLPLGDTLSLRIVPRESNAPGYPSGSIQKGLVLFHGEADLAEEGVGFGVPVLKQKLDTIFPGNARITAASKDTLIAEFDMNLAERFSTDKTSLVKSRLLTVVKEALAAVHRGFPPLRRPLSAISAGLRAVFSLKTVFHPIDSLGTVKLTYALDRASGRLTVILDSSAVAHELCTELIVMNEQGAHHFSRYQDSDGLCLCGPRIETWSEVVASVASLQDARHGLCFSLRRLPEARLFRGREVVSGRLAWAGFGYVLPAAVQEFRYSIAVTTTASGHT
jgi:hypothetical protein